MEALWMPLNDYLEHLPRLDGKDRVTALAERHPLLGETEGVAWKTSLMELFGFS